MKPNIGITVKKLHKSIDMLAVVLSSEMVLYTKTRKCHWNVAGASFMELHKLFEGQYKELEASIDEIAERIGKLGEDTPGTMIEFLKNSFISENPEKQYSSSNMLSELLEDHELMIVNLRKDIDVLAKANRDSGTVDFLTGLMEKHETNAWILRRYLNGKE
jgi:starvation-inducible DNA-binding protein